MGAAAPSGTVTFLFTDIEGSTHLWDSHPDAMRQALERHDALLRSAIDANDGYVFSTGGDGIGAAFARAGDAVAAAVDAQQALGAELWPDGAPLRVRMGLHTGETSERDGDYFGTAVNRAARLMATAHGGQVVCSRATADLAAGAADFHSLGEHRLRDLAAAEQVFQIGEGRFPPLRSVDVVPTNLPTTRTELVGRSEDVATLATTTARERLVTLTGVGGVGKTRLALAVAASVAPDYPDGCWLVDLAPVADGAEVAVATATAVRAPVTAAAALVTYLADRRMLVIIDNCEHVISDVADLVDAVLVGDPDIHLLATSREPLGLDGEVVRRVDSLGTAAPDASVEDALAAPAVRLFVERAAAVTDRFALDPATVGPVVEICRRLDGIPLAIELAAARTGSMPAAEIARRLDERFRLLSGGSRRAQERHRTLAATVSWSHDLLSEDDRCVFRRLAVFPASFTLDAAEQVVSDETHQLDVIDSLAGLVDRSLVQFDPDRGRYRLLETLRQYAADRLAEAGETEEVRERHARHFLGLVKWLGPQLHTDRFESAYTTLVAELDNLRATASWCIDLERWGELASFCRDSYYLTFQSAPVDGIEWRLPLVEHGSEIARQDLVDLLGDLAWTEVMLGNVDPGLRWAERSNELAEDGSAAHSAWALVAMGQAALYAGRAADSHAASLRAVDAAAAVDDPTPGVVARLTVSASLTQLGQLDASVATASEAMDRAEASGSPLNTNAAVTTAASNCLNRPTGPDFVRSREVIESAQTVAAVDSTNTMWICTMHGWTLLGLGEPDATFRLMEALRSADRLNAQNVVELALRLLAIGFAERGHREEAAILDAYVEANLREFRIMGYGQDWVQEQIRIADLPSPPAAAVPKNRGELMQFVTAVERSMSLGTAPEPDGR